MAFNGLIQIENTKSKLSNDFDQRIYREKDTVWKCWARNKSTLMELSQETNPLPQIL